MFASTATVRALNTPGELGRHVERSLNLFDSCSGRVLAMRSTLRADRRRYVAKLLTRYLSWAD